MGFTPHPSEPDELEEAHEINVTPFIDIILVLLIVFMVAAPLSTVDLPVNLPVAGASAPKLPDKPVYVTISADLSISLDRAPVARADLATRLNASFAANKEQRIFLRADKSVPYGEIMDVLERLRKGGFGKIALVAAESSGP